MTRINSFSSVFNCCLSLSSLSLNRSKDATARIWDARTGACLTTLSGHAASVTSVKWGGEGLIYTASQDRTVIVWAVDEQNNFSVKVARQLKVVT